MKLMFASDIHGVLEGCRKMLEAYRREQAERLVLLGDLLYHGPRNGVPQGYDPVRVTELLNGAKEDLLCVRGNCEAEVDQMVLDFPVLSDSTGLMVDGKMLFCTHGHLYHREKLPPLKKGDIFLYGHTHILKIEHWGELLAVNPGSVSLPKEGNPPSYMVYEDGVFTIKDMEGKTIVHS
ncbi:MAG: phosphodiesterase [Oscillospiraceae bacterium]|jgi:hypothetical protein|nr:phosphodiesterase [Oscillospiraceae bacterium]